MNDIGACTWCGDPINCDDTCEQDRIRQEEGNAAVQRIALRSAMRQFVTPDAPLPVPEDFGVPRG